MASDAKIIICGGLTETLRKNVRRCEEEERRRGERGTPEKRSDDCVEREERSRGEHVVWLCLVSRIGEVVAFRLVDSFRLLVVVVVNVVVVNLILRTAFGSVAAVRTPQLLRISSEVFSRLRVAALFESRSSTRRAPFFNQAFQYRSDVISDRGETLKNAKSLHQSMDRTNRLPLLWPHPGLHLNPTPPPTLARLKNEHPGWQEKEISQSLCTTPWTVPADLSTPAAEPNSGLHFNPTPTSIVSLPN